MVKQVLSEFESDAVKDRLEGWELVEYLQVPIEQVLAVALDNYWIDEDNIEDLLEFVGLKR